MAHRLAAKLEEFRQARGIHGGVVNYCAAALGVRLSRLPIPTKALRLKLYRTLYGKKYKALDESEFERPMWQYPSLNALFTRGVRPECRPIADARAGFACPCDGRVQDVGTLDHGRLLTAKGIGYSLESLLPGVDTRPYRGGRFGIFFLSPADCHRVFNPADGKLVEVVHVPGFRLLVHPPYQRAEFPVFTLNERVVLRFEGDAGPFMMVMVAGWGVGHITLAGGCGYRRRRRCLTSTPFAPPVAVRRGEWVATFELGSTVILIALPGGAALVERDEPVRYGQAVFRSAPE